MMGGGQFNDYQLIEQSDEQIFDRDNNLVSYTRGCRFE